MNRQKDQPSPQHGDFYESRRDSEETHEHQGGKVSPAQIEENAQPGGAKRLSYFRDRDYKP